MKRRNIVVATVAIGCCICACAYILRRERVALAGVIEGLEADGRRIREQELHLRWRLQTVGEFVVTKL